MTDRDLMDALAVRASEMVLDLPADQRERARAAMAAGEVYLRVFGNHCEVRCGKGHDAVCVIVHRASLGPRPPHADDN